MAKRSKGSAVGRRRAVLCGCGWSGSRLAHANDLPCPDCGGTVYLSHRGPGRPIEERVRLRCSVPRSHAASLGDNPTAALRELVRRHHEETIRCPPTEIEPQQETWS